MFTEALLLNQMFSYPCTIPILTGYAHWEPYRECSNIRWGAALRPHLVNILWYVTYEE